MIQVIRMLYDRLVRWLRTAPPGTVPLTGVLGLAFIIVGFYQLRSGSRDRRPRQQATEARGTQTAPSAESTGQGPSQTSGASAAAVKASQPSTPSIPVSSSVRSGLAGVKRVTMSVPGVLLQEWQAHELSDSATIRPQVALLMQQITALADVFLIAHVMDDVGQAAVTGALEASGILGTCPGEVRSHRLLFCSTLEGKVSIVRQLEPDLHVDGHAATIHDLQRFMPQLLHITDPTGSSLSAQSKPNVAQCPSLHSFFGL